MTLALFATLFVVGAPTASACDATDPTNATDTCIEEYDHGDPECSTTGAGGGGTTNVDSDLRGFAQILFEGSRGCYNGGTWGYQGQSIHLEVTSGQTRVRAEHHESSDPNTGTCWTGVHFNDPVTGSVGYNTRCAYGVVPDVPWGGLF